MKTPIAVCLVATLVLSSCSTVRTSRINPLNWFGNAQSQPVETGQAVRVSGRTGAGNPLLPERRSALSIFRSDDTPTFTGLPIATISDLRIERRPGGAIVRATGVAERAGPYNVRLEADPSATDADTRAYRFLISPGDGPRNTGPEARMVTAALWLSDSDLIGVSEVRMAGRTNQLVSRR